MSWNKNRLEKYLYYQKSNYYVIVLDKNEEYILLVKMKNKIQILGIILIVILVSFFAFNNKSQLEKNGIFVIGKVLKNTHGTGNDGLYFSFNYKSKKYQEWCFTNKEGKIGESYFCLVNPKEVNKSILLVDCPVPDSLISLSNEEWKKVPVKNHQPLVDEYFKTNIERFIEKIKNFGNGKD